MSAAQAFATEIADLVADKLASRYSEQRLFELEDAAKYMGMTPDALAQKSRAGQIPTVKLDKRLRFDRKDLDRLIDQARRDGV